MHLAIHLLHTSTIIICSVYRWRLFYIRRTISLVAILKVKKYRIVKITIKNNTNILFVKNTRIKPPWECYVNVIINNECLNWIVLLVWKWKNRRSMCKNVLNGTISRVIKYLRGIWKISMRDETKTESWRPWRIKLIDSFFKKLQF